MLGSEAVALMKRRLGFRRNLDTECLFELREAQKRAESISRTQPWFLMQENATITTVANVATVALPDNFIKETDTGTSQIRYTPIGSSDSLIGVRMLTKVDITNALPYYTESDGDILVGGPRSYVLENGFIRFFPTPDAAYTFYWNYHAKDEQIELGEENLWLQHLSDYLIGDAGVRLAMDIRNAQAAQTFTAMYNEGQKQLIAGNVEREWSGRDFYMGSN